MPAALDILLLAASMNSTVRHDDVGTSLKSTVKEFAHPALLARRLAAFRDHFFDVFTRSQISSFFLPPADCAALREPAGIARHAELKKKSRTSIRVSQVLSGAGRWPLPDLTRLPDIRDP